MDILQNIRVFEDTAGPVRIQVYESALVESDLSIHIHGGSERCWLSPWLVPPGPMGEEGVGIRHPLLLAGGMVTPYWHSGCRHHYAPRPVYLPPPGVVYVAARGAVHAPVPGPVYGGGFIGTGISLPGVGFSFSFRGH
jgi:hypothetical protein